MLKEGICFGVRHHDVAFIYGDMSPCNKAVSCATALQIYGASLANLHKSNKKP
ncbi:MAG: hypothetical protein AB1546_00615 [bacterium]